MDLTSLLVQVVAGAIGGSAAGAAAKQYSLGTLGNAIAGAIGGGIVGQLIGAVAGSAVEGWVGNFAGGSDRRCGSYGPGGPHQGGNLEAGLVWNRSLTAFAKYGDCDARSPLAEKERPGLSLILIDHYQRAFAPCLALRRPTTLPVISKWMSDGRQ